MRPFAKLIILLLLLTAGWILWTWDSSPPKVAWIDPPPSLGRTTTLNIRLTDDGRGISTFKVQALQSGKSHSLLEQPAGRIVDSFFWGGSQEEILKLSLGSLITSGSLSEGEIALEVQLSDTGRIGLWSREVRDRRTFVLDLTPPEIEVISQRHYIRQGGSQAVLYSVSEPSSSTGILMGDRSFRGYPAPWKGDNVYICLFALSHDEDPASPTFVWARDQAGNRGRTRLQSEVIPGKFRNRRINVNDRFFQAVLPEILDRTPEVKQAETPLETFLEVNGRLRQENHEQIETIARKSLPRPLWGRAFVQLSKSKVESVFADYRSYYYKGRKVDEQTHLGFDLASVARAAIECSNDGVVAYANYLGIYGNCVIVDHGLGLLSLYAHLSTIQVEPGEQVARGQTVGLSGQTGLAGGDHLHFSMIIQGVHVNPLEWWDRNWLGQQLLPKLKPDPSE